MELTIRQNLSSVFAILQKFLWHFLFLILLLFICIERNALNQHLPGIKEVKIIGTYEHISPANLKNIILPYAQQGFFNADIQDLRAHLLQIPWVKQAVITRFWPHTLEIQIAEQIPVALWNGQGLMNYQGELFIPEKNSFPMHLPLFLGSEGQERLILNNYQTMLKLLEPLHLKIKVIQQSERQAYSLALENNVRVILGREDVLERLQRFVHIYPQLIKGKESMVNYVDMRYPNGMAIRWKIEG